MIELGSIITSLVKNDVAFVITGELALVYYGFPTVTQVSEFCYSTTPTNLERTISALRPFNPQPRNNPHDSAFIFDETTLQSGKKFKLDTDGGAIDLLGEIAGVGTYAEVENGSVETNIFDQPVKIISLEALIDAKRAAGRTKDLLILPELEALLKLRNEEINN